MSFGKYVARGAIGMSMLGSAAGAYGYINAENRAECASVVTFEDQIFCGLGQGSSEQAIDKIEEYVQTVQDFFMSFMDNPDEVPAAVAAYQFGLEASPNSALRLPEGMPEFARDLTNQQIMELAGISFNDIKRYWTEFRKVDINRLWLEPIVPIGSSYPNCGGLAGDEFAGVFCSATMSVALSEHLRYGVPADASSQQMHVYIYSVLAHEAGHAVQIVRGASDAGRAAVGLTLEEQATCLGGNSMAGETPQVTEYVASYMARTAFLSGLSASRCGI